MDCLDTLGMNPQASTNAALGQSHYYLPYKFTGLSHTRYGTQYTKEPANQPMYPFSFKWSVFMFLISAISFLGCKFLWKTLESNHQTYMTDAVRGIKSDPEKRKKIASDIIKYLNVCKQGSMLFFKFLFANTITLLVMIALEYWYLEFINYFEHPFSIVDFYNWTHQQAEDRTDFLSKKFPRTLVFPYHRTGPSGTEEHDGILCTSSINRTLEYLYVCSIFFLPILLVLQIFSILFSLYHVIYFHKMTTLEKQLIPNLKSLSYDQRLICILLSKNVDLNLWVEILNILDTTDFSTAMHVKKKNQDMLAMCPIEEGAVVKQDEFENYNERESERKEERKIDGDDGESNKKSRKESNEEMDKSDEEDSKV